MFILSIIPIALAFFMGYIYGYWIKPNRQLKETIRRTRESCLAALEDGRKGVYKTIVMDGNKSSELVVEVKEQAVTELGQVKVQYLSAYYKNPDFRTRKGEALLKEVHSLLGEYLPVHEIEWFDPKGQQQNIKNYLNTLEEKPKKYFSL